MRSALAFVAFLFFLPLQAAPARSEDQGSGFRVSVYTNVNTSPDSIPYDELDGLVLAFFNPVDGCGSFSSTTIPGAKETARRARTQNAKGYPLFVTFAVGGGGNKVVNELLESIASSSTCRKQFAGQVAKILTENDLDGVNFDWEFPSDSSLDNYTLLVQELRKAIGKKLLSIAIYNDAGKGKAMGLTQGVIPFVDYYMVMAYLSPRNAAIDAWVNPPWNLPENKLRLGLAFFGDPVNGGPSMAYKDILGTVPSDQASPCVDRVGIYVINGLRTTGELTRFAMTEKLGGVTAWELEDDRTDSISLLSDASEVSRMWENFAQWQSGKKYPVGTVIQNQGNLWMVKSSSTKTPSLTNPAYLQYEPMPEFSDQDYYCGGEEIWFDGAVYRAVQDPMLSVTDQSPTGDPPLWKKLYAASLYDDSRTYEKGDRVFFNDSVYVANKTTQGVSPAKSLANWSPVVDADAFDIAASYPPGATVRYMGNEYRSIKSSKGLNPVEATDSWVPVTN